jgi:hypothetical protein
MQENQAAQQTGGTGTGPGTASGAAATGGRQTEERPYTQTTTTYESQGRGRQPTGQSQPYYGHEAQGRGGGRSLMETGSSTTHGGLALVLAGLLTFLVGLAFVVRHGFYHGFAGYAYNWGIVSWGWVLFGLGIVTFAVGASHLLGIPMSRPAGITLAVLTVVAGFMIVPFYPIWAIIIAALGLYSLWGLSHGHEQHEREQREYDEREYERQRMM